jgi:prevent-host-death family protein
MATYTIHDAKTQFSRLVDRALSGEDVIIARRKRPLVKLTPLQTADRSALIGDLKGKVRMSRDFNAPMPDFEEYR